MSDSKPEQTPQTTVAGKDIFATTRWTVVIAAGRSKEPQADVALEELCRTYWYPLYAYVRRRGYSHEDGEDLTQAFFTRFLEKNYLEGLSSEKGRFRAFLLVALVVFLFLQDFRSTLIPAIAVPVSLIGTFFDSGRFDYRHLVG